MTIKIWNSYSCNNSSSFRLVARFADPETAGAAAAELTSFLAEHAKQMDAAMAEGDFPDESPPAAAELARRYGFTWSSVLGWGDDVQEGDEPSVSAEGPVLVVYHTYCSGFSDLPAYLRAKGGTVEPETHRAPPLSALFRNSPELELDLAVVFAQPVQPEREVEPFRAPWEIRWESSGQFAYFRDPGAVGLWFPCAPTDLPAVKQWLADHGVAQPSLRWCEYQDETTFVAIAAARCSACASSLEYLDPRIHDIESPQLVCKACGGLYELSTFLPKS